MPNEREVWESGHVNRETWAFISNWENDATIYPTVIEAADVWADRFGDYLLGEKVIRLVRELWEDEQAWPQMLDVGSWWRIDYREVGQSVRESLPATA